MFLCQLLDSCSQTFGLQPFVALEGTKTIVSCMEQTPVTAAASAGFKQAWTGIFFLFFFRVITMNKTPFYLFIV